MRDMRDCFSGYPEREPERSVDLSIVFDVETFRLENEQVGMITERPIRHRIIIEGTIERMAPYLVAVGKLAEDEKAW